MALESIREHVFVPFRQWFFGQSLEAMSVYNPAFMLMSPGYFLYPSDYGRVIASRRPRASVGASVLSMGC